MEGMESCQCGMLPTGLQEAGLPLVKSSWLVDYRLNLARWDWRRGDGDAVLESQLVDCAAGG